MKVVLFLLSVVAFIVITSKISRFLSKRVESVEKEIEEENKRNEGFKEVLKKENCSSTTKRPKDICMDLPGGHLLLFALHLAFST